MFDEKHLLIAINLIFSNKSFIDVSTANHNIIPVFMKYLRIDLADHKDNKKTKPNTKHKKTTQSKTKLERNTKNNCDFHNENIQR